MFRIIHSSKDDLDFGKRFARTLYGNMVGKPVNQRRAFFQIKNSLEFPDLCQAADYIDKNVNERFKQRIFGNSLPKLYKDLGKCEFSSASENLINEINWTLISIRKYSYEINLFLVYKEAYENSLLTGDFDGAEKYLSKIEKEICVSVWSLENRFLLSEYAFSTSENKEFLSKFNEENQSDLFTKPLAHFLSIRSEKSLSVDRYNTDLIIALNNLKGDKKEQHIDYYLFNLSFLNNLDFENYIEIMAYEFQHSIIDRYLNLRKIFSSLLITANNMAEKIEDGKLIKNYITNRLNYILRKVNDPILFKLKLFASEKLFPAFDESKSIKELSAIDKYTAGLYAEVEEDLKQLLIEKPSQFDLYLIYINTLVYQKKNFQPIGNTNSIQNSILSEMHKIISVSVNPREPGIILGKIANNLASNILSYGIIDFVNYRTKGKNERKLLGRLSYNLANPVINEIYADLPSKLNYLGLLKSKFPNSLSIDFLYKTIENADNISNFISLIPQTKYKVEQAKIFQAKDEYRNAIEIWNKLILEESNVPVIETAIRNLYICYEKLKEYDNCIRLYVKSYFYNEFIVSKIETQNILTKIQENRFKIVSPIIELPIFYTLTSPDETDIHTAFEKFNLKLGCCKPSEILSKYSDFEAYKILFFLKNTCTQEILKHSIHINGSKDRLEERLEILKFLKGKDQNDIKFYEDEIKSITNILIIQQGLLELDESKIYVNEQGIVTNELKEFESIYIRFKAISKIAEKNKLKILGSNARLVIINYTEESTYSDKIEYSNNPVYDVYKELFDVIKEKFLYSKFGIVAYLSTRIRHGVLIGEIRPIFEKHRLITQKEGELGAYRRNIYWDNIYRNENSVKQNLIQELLKEFSYAVDGLIYDLIKKYLQVFEKDKRPDGWFNYDFTDDSLFWFSIRSLQVKDFNHFANEVFDILWDRTDNNLKDIRDKIQVDIARLFNELFDKLEKDIVELLDINNSQILIKSIKACSTEVQTAIKRISSWFKRSGTATSDFKLENLIDIVMEYCNKSKSAQKINLKRQLKFDKIIKGEYYTHFADLLRIFIENILKHANEKTPLIDAYIDAREENESLIISIGNTITKRESIDAFKGLREGEHMNLLKLVEENKSGYHKAFKILKSDLGSDGNNFYTEVVDEKDFLISMHIRTDKIIK